MQTSQVSNDIVLSMEAISKSFPGVQALDQVNFELRKGEVHALVGENGAGKTTLMNVLNGMVAKDTGRIVLDGQEVEIRTPLDARQRGISFIHQELELIPNLTVKENIFLGQEPRTGLLRRIDWASMEHRSAEFLERLNIHVDPNEELSRLTIAEQQLIEVAKALHLQAKIIVMDEPTSSLSDDDVRNLFRIIRELKSQGFSVIYVSHVMDEIFEISDRITVLRGGQYIGTEVTAQTSQEKIFQMIVGKEVEKRYIREQVQTEESILQVQGLSTTGPVQDIHFDLRRGELLGIAGLVGSGRTELLEALFGVNEIVAGDIQVNGQPIQIHHPASAIAHGFYYVSENRRDKGIFPTLNITRNVGVSTMFQHTSLWGINNTEERTAVTSLVDQLNIKTPNLEQIVAYLSGGNQQKVILARGLKSHPRIVMLNEPTRGIDIGAKVEIYRLLNRLKEEGLGIIMASSELPEVMGISDRIMVMSAGRVAGFFDGATATKHDILEAMFKYVGQKGSYANTRQVH
ncbi:ATP-binding cassette domain-containing protein [candidate division KSB3 bacterium]|uniref:Ribose/galactose/methyl galactoside import ATP-binding protein n=1 Tax=candidate division KSB3 bacterium TaxID=2044937 RepID=A0A9D5JVM8_9BACT|nr:ATP-binding cassette domain-containing protein [candidate division KSB3 bacterium]MBD3325112.1 ATP-binding cassette domain-containing protein [candidate division KSB3 bacterium]